MEGDGEEISFLCMECGKEFVSEKKLIMHCKLVHEKGDLKCDECEFNCETKNTLYSHRYTKHRQHNMLTHWNSLNIGN